jgi:epsilon-lactone hydrolase
MPSPESKKLIEMIRAQRATPPATPPTVADQRANMESMARPPDADVTVETVDANGVPAEWISAPSSAAERVILYVHGGGYVIGSLNTHRQLCGWLAKAAESRVLALDYRLGPEHPFPAAVDDAVAGYDFLLSQGVAPESIVIAGDSAGGGLTAATLLALRDGGRPLPAAAVLISPWTDLALTGESMTTRAAIDPMIPGAAGVTEMAARYLAGGDPKNPLASPLYGDLAGLPPLLIQVGTEEVLFDDASRFDAKARAAGVDVTFEAWNGQVHVFQTFAFMVPEAREAIDRIGAFVKEHAKVATPA